MYRIVLAAWEKFMRSCPFSINFTGTIFADLLTVSAVSDFEFAVFREPIGKMIQ